MIQRAISRFNPQYQHGLVATVEKRVASYLRRTLMTLGMPREHIHIALSLGQAFAALDEAQPHFVVIHADITQPEGLDFAWRINKKRVCTDRLTPKILALLDPDVETVLDAKACGFFDVISLPASPDKMRARLLDIFARLE